MAQYYRTRLVWSLAGNSLRQHISDSSQPHVPERVLTVTNSNHLAVLGASTLGDDDHRVAWTL